MRNRRQNTCNHIQNTKSLNKIIQWTVKVTKKRKFKRRVSHVKQELLTLPEHLRSPPVFVRVRFVRSLAFCVVFGRSLFVLLSFFSLPLCCLSFCLFSLCRCVVCPSSVSVCGFGFTFWSLHICLKKWWWTISPIIKVNSHLSSQNNEHEKENVIWRW